MRSFFLLAVLSGCAETADDDCWWCDDEAVEGDGQEADAADDGKDDTKDDTKDDAEDTKDDTPALGEDYMTFSGVVDIASGTGTLSFASADYTALTGCALSYPIEAATVADCGDCDASWSLELGAVFIESDKGLCEPGLEYDTTDLHIGYADTVILISEDGAVWQEEPSSDSSLAGDSWTFSWSLL